jgi:hypothetical protein
MNISNHLLAGAAIALAIKQPVLVLPLAFASHFVMDALPHYGFERQGFDVWRKKKSAGLLIVLDFIGVFLVISTLLMNHEYFALIAGLVAVSPDSVWIYRYFRFERKHKAPSYNWFNRMHLAVQWCERRWGIYVEFVFFIVLFTCVQLYLI